MINILNIHTSTRKINPVALEELLENADTATAFQTLAMLDFFKTVGLETFSYAIECNHKITAFVSGIIQKEKGIKSPFTSRAIIFGGPVFAADVTPEQIQELFQLVIKKLKHKVIYIETRNFNSYLPYKESLEKVGFEYHPHLNFHLNCDTEEAVKKRMSSSKVRQIKKSLKQGAIYKEATSEKEIEAYYLILETLYKTKVKTPLPDLAFFITLWRKDTAKFLVIIYEEEVIGGIVCPILANRVIYEWYVCGKDGVHKNIYPSILATWAAIAYACKHNIPRFDFMGAGKPNEAYGVREFKSKFGGDQVAHGRFIYVANPLLYGLGKKAVKVIKKW